jgi:hypothetical protein
MHVWKELIPASKTPDLGIEYKGYGHDVVVFEEAREESDLTYTVEKVTDTYCTWCRQNKFIWPEGKCTGAFIKLMRGTNAVIAEAPKTIFTRTNAIASCKEEETSGAEYLRAHPVDYSQETESTS